MRAMSAETSVLKRAGIGCGLATGTFVLAFALMLACTLVASWLNPTGTRGLGEGVGFLLVPFFPAAAVAGLVGAFFPRVGLGLASLILACAIGLGIVLLVQYA
jgi:hypothetical protein